MNNKITIITPTLNQAKYLEQTIDSVLSQNYPSLEYIIIDGGSTDGTIDIIKKYENHIIYWESTPDNGQSHAINKGIKKATGDIVNWLNSDDYYEPDTLKLVNENFNDPSINCLCGKSRLFNDEGYNEISNGTDIYAQNLMKTIGWARIDQPATFFRKIVWDKVGLLNEQLHYTMDREWWMRFLYQFGLEGIKINDEVLVNFRLHNSSKTLQFGEKFQIEHDSLFYLLSLKFPEKNYSELLDKSLEIDKNLESEISKWKNKDWHESILNHYLLKRADEMYYQNDCKHLKAFLSIIDKNFLDKDEKSVLNKLKFRSKIPQAIINLLRKKLS